MVNSVLTPRSAMAPMKKNRGMWKVPTQKRRHTIAVRFHSLRMRDIVNDVDCLGICFMDSIITPIVSSRIWNAKGIGESFGT